MGIHNELDLFMGEGQDKYETAKGKLDRGLIQYSQTVGEVKKAK